METKKKAIVFGYTSSAKKLYEQIEKKYEIVAFCDNDKNKWGGEEYSNKLKVIDPMLIFEIQWDEIIIISLSSMNIIKKQLLDMGVNENKINTSYIDFQVRARETFLRDYATIVYDSSISGCVAEAGVFQGEFAHIINQSFPDRKLYLFDTFGGFDERDIEYEEKNNFSNAAKGQLSITSEDLVLQKMKYPDNCIICKGYFPESAKNIKEHFVFVNLDMDLYKPTLEGLRFFYPLMVKGGIIVIHDFFSQGYEGVNAAINEFLEEIKDKKIIPFPIGDHVSIAIQKG